MLTLALGVVLAPPLPLDPDPAMEGSEEEPVLELAAAPAPPPAHGGDTITWSWDEGLTLRTADGSVKGNIGGRVQWDASWLDVDDSLGLDDGDGTEARRARFNTELEVDGFRARAEYDFAGQDVDFTEVWVGRGFGFGDVRVGHTKEPFSIEYLTSANRTTFLERSLMNAFGLGRNTGVLTSGRFGEGASWQLGVFKNGADNAGVAVEDGAYAATGRVSGTPLYADGGERLLHLGAAYSRRDTSMLRLRSRPEIHLAPFTVDTADIATEDVTYANVELAGVFGPAHFQAEATTVSASGAAGVEDFDASGYYAQVGYFLTGESRPYKRGSGKFGRVSPLAPYGADGCGAWEVALRFSSLDLTDGAVVGGEQDDVTLGLNWYATANLRVSANYVRGSVDQGGALDDEDVSAFLTRVQMVW